MATNKKSVSRVTEVTATLPGIIAPLDAAQTGLAERMAVLEQQGL